VEPNCPAGGANWATAISGIKKTVGIIESSFFIIV